MLRYLLFFIVVKSAILATGAENEFLTQTVYGFLDFTTTIGNTVMVFSPQSAPPIEIKSNKSDNINIIETKPLHKEVTGINPTKLSNSSPTQVQPEKVSTEKKSIIKITPEANVSRPIENNLNFPEYDLLSRQPEEYAEETYRLYNLKSKADPDRRQYSSTKENHPVGLVTKFSETYTRNGQPTVKETSVLGTYISGKYAQILQSASVSGNERKPKPRATSSNRILKSAAPTIQPSRIAKEPNVQSSAFTKHHRKNSQSNRETTAKVSKGATSTRKSSRHKGKRRNKTSQAFVAPSTVTGIEPSTRRSFRNKPSSSIVSAVEFEASPTQSSFKLNRRPGRWQYKSSPKPKINIRKSSPSNATLNAVPIDNIKANEFTPESTDENQIQKIVDSGRDLDSAGSQNNDEELKPKNFVQTLNVEISTPNNFVDTYYEIATIKSPFIFQAGVVKKTRFLTVTSTIEKVIKDEHTETYSEDDGPLTENILEPTTKTSQATLDGSITTLNPIFITDSTETPNLETITESFSITQTKLKTQVLPVINEKQNETIFITMVQTYDYTSLITVTQTGSPFINNFIPSKNFKDFEGNLDEAGSEINLDLEFGDEDNLGQFDSKLKPKSKAGDLIPTPEKQPETPDKNQLPLPALSGINQSNNVITTTRPVVKMETLWESHVIPLVKGTETVLRTLSKSIGVVEKTDFVTEVSTLPAMPVSQFPPYSINPYFNPLLPIPPQQFITSTEVLQTSITETKSKILKLTFGARTAFTTIYSTAVVPTAVTKVVTTQFPMQNTGSFPNYYPPPYPPFAYVG